MPTATHELAATVLPTPSARRVGLALTGLATVFFLMDAGGKLIAPDLMIANSPPLGLPPDGNLYRLLGAVLAACTFFYAWSRTALLGAVLLTGFLGGAIAVNLRAEMPLFTNTLFGVYVGVIMWAGLILRRPQILYSLGIRSRD